MKCSVITISLSLVMILVNQTSLADCPTQLSFCDVALKASLQVNTDLKTQIGNYAKQSILQQQIIQDQGKELGEWYRKPEIVVPTIVVVVLTGLLATGHLK
jgi:hypothetical protein